MDIVIPVATFLIALFGIVAAAAGHESRDGFEIREHSSRGY